MHSLDHQVLIQLQQWLARGQRPWLCSIVATHGSSPRPVGSLMACNPAGEVAGSLSGGCVEDDLIARLQAADHPALPCVIEYGLSAEENARLGLPCGGHISVLVEQWSEQQLPLLQTVNAHLSQRSCIERSVDLGSGAMSIEPVARFRPLTLTETRFSQVYGPRFNLLLVGAGQIAQCLAAMAGMMDYRVIITDPRPDKLEELTQQLDGERLEYEVVGGMPDDVVTEWASDPFSIVITLGHDPRIDDVRFRHLALLLRHCSYWIYPGSSISRPLYHHPPLSNIVVQWRPAIPTCVFAFPRLFGMIPRLPAGDLHHMSSRSSTPKRAASASANNNSDSKADDASKSADKSRKKRRYRSVVRQQQSHQTREQIITSGVELAHEFPSWDWKNLTFRAVGERAGISERTVYRYFPTEQALKSAVIHRLTEESGINLNALTLNGYANTIKGLFLYMQSFAAKADEEKDPTFSGLDEERRQALVRIVAYAADGWSETQVQLAAATLDMLWQPQLFERLLNEWQFDTEKALGTLDWLLKLIKTTVENGPPPEIT